MQETRVQFLGQEDPLEERIATTPFFLPGEFHGEKPGGLQSMRSRRVGHGWITHTHINKCKVVKNSLLRLSKSLDKQVNFCKSYETLLNHNNDYIAIVSGSPVVVLKLLIPSWMWTKILVLVSMFGRQKGWAPHLWYKIFKSCCNALLSCFTD